MWNRRSGRYIIQLSLVAVVAVASGLGLSCGSDSNPYWEPDRPNPSECDRDADCPQEQPYCSNSECFPCLRDSHCGDGAQCANPNVEVLSPRYCTSCILSAESGGGFNGCPEGMVCDVPECDDETLDCNGRATCVEAPGPDTGEDTGVNDGADSGS